jgi:hypothetical protein
MNGHSSSCLLHNERFPTTGPMVAATGLASRRMYLDEVSARSSNQFIACARIHAVMREQLFPMNFFGVRIRSVDEAAIKYHIPGTAA